MDIPATICRHPPDHKALFWHRSSTESESFTYAQLWHAVSATRDAISQISAESGTSFIGVLAAHEPCIVPAILGIMCAKLPFVCIDSAASVNTIETQLEAFDVTLFLTAHKFHQTDGVSEIFTIKKTLAILCTTVYVYVRRIPKPGRWQQMFDSCNIMFGVCTSGSTGSPKLLAVPEQCFIPNVKCLEIKYHLTPDDRVYLSAPPTFDPFLLDMMITLRAGATIVLVSATLRLSPDHLAAILFPSDCKKNSITVMPLTPSLLYRFNDTLLRTVILHATSKLRLLIVGGEQCPDARTLRRWRPHGLNQMRVIYLYGLTEISCWSMAYELNAGDFTSDKALPMGELLDEDGHWSLYDRETAQTMPKQVNTVGELVLHSPSRFTYVLESDSATKHPTQLHTGDIVEYLGSNGGLHYRTRSDHMIKRFGTRVSPTAIEQFCRQASVDGVLAGVRCLWQPERGGVLLLFVHINTTLEVRAVRAELLQRLRSELKSNHVPDEVLCVHKWPVTKHGKFDWRRVWEDNQRDLTESLSDFFVRQLKDRLSHDVENESWTKRSFIDLGGSSFEAMYIVNKVTQLSGLQLPELIGMLLNNEWTIQQIIDSLPTDTIQPSMSSEDKNASSAVLPPRPAHIKWSVNMHKCVDATATVLHYQNHEYVAIGSHSHRLLVLCADDGSIQCSQELPDRIEGRVRQFGPADCHAVVGCYDGCAYAFDFRTGERLWTVQTSGMIKSQPLWLSGVECLVLTCYLNDTDPSASNVWCVNAETGARVWMRRLGEKSICASPIAIDVEDVLVCTLDGTVARLDGRTGTIRWQNRFDASIFATPRTLQHSTFIVLADVSGIVHCIDVHSGTEQWSYRAGGNLFSSFALFDDLVVFGCQDSHVYCLRGPDGTLQWRCTLNAPVYATPMLWMGSDRIASSSIVACSTTGQMVCIDVKTGRLLNEWSVNGEVFSSPVELRDGAIVFGSRDDHVYCVDLMKKTE